MLPTLPAGLEYSRECVDSNGIGVRTLRAWKKGEKIGDYVGTRMTKPEFRSLYGKDITNTYWITHNFPWSYVLVAKEPRNFIGYINEGLDANVELKKYALWVKKDIGTGEEFLLRYAKTYPRTYQLL